MFDHNRIQKLINEGERLVPGFSHDFSENVIHKSSYKFFSEIIACDQAANGSLDDIKILDVGCGVGHGTHMLSLLSNSTITGIDNSALAIEFAEQNYNAENLNFVEAGLDEFTKNHESFDYIVSRHAIEHIDNGIEQILSIQCNRRILINVPYDEDPGNEHHAIHNIGEKSFNNYPNPRFFYEKFDGATSDTMLSEGCVSIICVGTANQFKDNGININFPTIPWQPNALERLALLPSVSSHNTFNQGQIARLQNLKQWETDLSKKEEALEATQDELRTLGANLTKKEDALEATQDELKAWGANLTKKEEALEATQDELRTWGANLTKKEEALEATQDEFKTWGANLTEKKEALEATQDEISTWVANLTKKEESLNSTQRGLDKWAKELALQASEAAIYRDELEKWRRLLLHQNDRVNQLEKTSKQIFRPIFSLIIDYRLKSLSTPGKNLIKRMALKLKSVALKLRYKFNKRLLVRGIVKFIIWYKQK